MVSMYRNKYEGEDGRVSIVNEKEPRYLYFKLYGIPALRKYRKVSPNLSKGIKDKLLQQAGTYVKNYPKLKQAPDPSNPFENPPWPTFSELSQLILQDGACNEHWATYYNLCAPCKVNYTDVVRMETLNRDVAYILRKSGQSAERWRMDLNKADGKASGEVWKDYFKTLPKNLLDLYAKLNIMIRTVCCLVMIVLFRVFISNRKML